MQLYLPFITSLVEKEPEQLWLYIEEPLLKQIPKEDDEEHTAIIEVF